MISIEAFRDALCELDVEPQRVIADPRGETWLPAPLRELCARDPAAREELHEFVQAEIALSRLSAGAAPSDPFFTAAVVRALPSRFIGSRLSPHRRVLVLGAFYLGAAAAAWAVLAMLTPSGPWAQLADQAHVLADTAGSPLGYAIAAAVAVALVLVAGLPPATAKLFGIHRGGPP